METYNEDRSRFLTMVGIEEDIMEERIHMHAGDSVQETTKSLFKEITKEVRETLIELYKYEFDLFEYDPNIYWEIY